MQWAGDIQRVRAFRRELALSAIAGELPSSPACFAYPVHCAHPKDARAVFGKGHDHICAEAGRVLWIVTVVQKAALSFVEPVKSGHCAQPQRPFTILQDRQNNAVGQARRIFRVVLKAHKSPGRAIELVQAFIRADP